MSSFVPSKSHLRHSLLFLFHHKKHAVEAHRLLVETYSEHAPVIRTCETWFRQFKSKDFDLTDNEHPGAQLRRWHLLDSSISRTHFDQLWD